MTALSGILLGWTGRGRELRRELKTEVSTDVQQQVDIEYIKRGIDDIKVEQRTQRQEVQAMDARHARDIQDMDIRLTRVEESAKQAHLRINRVDALQNDKKGG